MSVLVIAEAGVNHQGRLDTALELISAAKDAGADVCKFQAFSPWKLTTDYARQAMLKGLALTENELRMCAAECARVGIEFMCTPMDHHWLRFCVDELRVKRIKIGSGQAGNLYFVRDIAKEGLPVIISNGMVDMPGLHHAYDALGGAGADITILSCVSTYPTPDTEVSLEHMIYLRDSFPAARIGFSSHCRSFWPSVAAVYAGATVIEQHIALPGCTSPDATSSLLPEEFAAMVREIRAAESAYVG